MPTLPIKVQTLTKRKTWGALEAHFKQARRLHLCDLFAQDPKRGERITMEAVGLYLDYSKNRITDETLKLLFELATESGLRDRIDAMFRGDKINVTENRAVLHVALRAPKEASTLVDGKNVVPEIHQVLQRMATSQRSLVADGQPFIRELVIVELAESDGGQPKGAQ